MGMITYDEALAIILEHGKKDQLGIEAIPLTEVPGRTSAVEIFAARANQPFDNSAMDGFALKAEDLENAANDKPVMLEMIGHLAAGGALVSTPTTHGQCYEIMTGANLPPGCDAVVPVEKTERGVGGCVLFKSSVKTGDNIRRAAADFAVGEKVLDAGIRMNPGHVLTLATLGIGTAKVFKRTKVAFISTGMEVVDDLGGELRAGQIYNSTKAYLAAIAPQMGLEILFISSVGDDEALFKSNLQKAVTMGCDLVLSTGAVSAGVHDFVPAALKQLGAETYFHRAAIRPGKPIFFARLPDGGPFFFGLPGNPVSTVVGLRFFVEPLLRILQRLPMEKPRYALLAADYKQHKSGLRFFLRGALNCGEDGINTVSLLSKQQSFMVSPFVRSNSWVVIPEDAVQLRQGDPVAIYQ